MSWLMNGVPFTEIDPEYFAFVYEIQNTETGKLYIGKKLFWFKRKKKLVESDWKSYHGSNKELLADVAALGTDKFKRTIIKLCRTKGEASYFETKRIFETDALLSENFYNSWVMCRIRKSHICPNKNTKTKAPKATAT